MSNTWFIAEPEGKVSEFLGEENCPDKSHVTKTIKHLAVAFKYFIE
jgi:hypothetical protein